MTTTPELTGPFKTALQILDASSDPGYAKRAADVPSGSPGAVARTMARLYSTRDDEAA